LVGASAARFAVIYGCYWWNRRRYDLEKLGPTWGSRAMPIFDIFSPEGKMDDWIEEQCRDPAKPDRFRTVVNMGPFVDGSQIVLVNDADAIATALENPASFPKVPMSLDGLKALIGEGLATSEGELWHRNRKLLTPLFHFAALREAFPCIIDNTVAFCDRMEQQIDASPNKQAIVTRIPFNDLALRIVIDNAFSGEFDPHWMEDAWTVAVRRAMDCQMISFLLGPLGRFISRQYVHLKVGQISDKIKGVVHKRKQLAAEASPKPSSRRDLVSLLMDTEGMADQQRVDESLTFLFAGHDTTSNLIGWALYLLSKHPDKQRLGQAEADLVLGGRAVEQADLPKLQYTKWIIKETLRMKPPVMLLDRLCREELKVADVTLPKGTIVWLGFFFVANDERHFDSPNVFMPERWDETTDTQTGANARHPYAYTPFSAGPRNCIGQKFALMEVQVVLASILQRFHVSLAGQDRVTRVLQGTTAPMNLMLRLTKR